MSSRITSPVQQVYRSAIEIAYCGRDQFPRKLPFPTSIRTDIIITSTTTLPLTTTAWTEQTDPRPRSHTPRSHVDDDHAVTLPLNALTHPLPAKKAFSKESSIHQTHRDRRTATAIALPPRARHHGTRPRRSTNQQNVAKRWRPLPCLARPLEISVPPSSRFSDASASLLACAPGALRRGSVVLHPSRGRHLFFPTDW
jgi:hypothetical protein